MRSAANLVASVRPWRAMLDLQTLRVCSEIVQGLFKRLCYAACQLAKRYVCASSAFPAVETNDDSSVRTRRRPPNVTHVMVFEYALRVRETLSKPMKYQRFHRRAYPFEALRQPNLRGRKVW